MKKAILGTKVGMTQMFREDGTMIPVTVVLAGPCPVVQKKTAEHDGYEAIQVAFKPCLLYTSASAVRRQAPPRAWK